MAVVTKDLALNDVIRSFPQTVSVFNRYRIDACCGGARTVAEAAAEDEADLEALLEDLNSAAVPAAKGA